MIRKTEKAPTHNSATTTPTIAATAEFLSEEVAEVGKVELAVEDIKPVMMVQKKRLASVGIYLVQYT